MTNIHIGRREKKEYVVKAYQMAWPAVMESFFIALAGLIDSFMVSSIGAYAVAAVGLTTQPKFIGLSLFVSINVAVSSLTARRKGEKNPISANRIFLVGFIFTISLGILTSLACIFLADPIIYLCGSNADTHNGAVLYFRIIMGGMLFNIITMVINASHRGSGNTKIVMKTNMTSSIVNIIGNYLLIRGNLGFPALGIKGAAMATVLGTVVACIMSIYSVTKKSSFINIPLMLKEKIRPALQPAVSIIKIGSGVFIEQILMRTGFMAVAVMAANLGTNAFAAHQVGMNIMAVSFSFGDGMQAAAVALIGQSLGERNPEKAKAYGRICQKMGFLISVVLSVTYFFGGSFLYRLFFEEEEIIHFGIQIMRVIMVIVLLQIAAVIYMGCLRGAGDILFTTATSTIAATIIRPITCYLLCYLLGWGLVGIWIGITSDQLTRFTLAGWRFKSGTWTGIKI